MNKNFFTKLFLSTAIFVGALIFLNFQLPHTLADKPQINDRKSDIFFQGKPSLTQFTSRDGLPMNSVMTIERDRRGYIWFGTQDGAAFFNGHNISVVNMPNRAASNFVIDILSTKDGSVWFATNNGGIHKLLNNEWQSFNSENGLASNETRVLLESKKESESVIWVGRRDGLSKFENNNWTNYTDKDGFPDPRVRSLLETTDADGNSSLWIGTYDGIAVWSGEEKKIYKAQDGLKGKTIFSLLETKNGQNQSVVWAGTDKGLAKFENGIWETFENVSEQLANPVRALGKTQKVDGTITLWVGFDTSGVAYLEKDKWYFLDEKDGLPNNPTYAFSETGSLDGSVWISCLGSGVHRFERSNWRSIEDKTFLPNKVIFDIDETISATGEKSFWFATFGGGLARFVNGKWKTYTKADGIGNNYVYSLYSTKDSNGEEILYIGTELGLLKYQNNKFEKIKLIENIPITVVWDIEESKTESGETSLIVSSSAGLFIKTGDRLEYFKKANGLPDSHVRDALETVNSNGEKTLWVGTYSGGLAKFQNGNWTIFDDTNGLPTNRIYSIAEIKFENKRQLWVGTGGGGIVIFDLDNADGKMEIISTGNSRLLPGDTVYKIIQDDRNRIYASTTKGVSRITPQPENSFAKFDSYIYTIDDGLPENECNSGAAFIDSLGRVWIGTVGGAGLLDVSREINDSRAEPLFLENILVNGEPRSIQPNTVFPYNENNLIFQYVMPTNFRENSTEYQTQLAGLEEKPTEWTKEPRREFSFLPSGEYVFKIWGKDAGGNVSGPLEVPFRIRPAWWQTWWAFILYLLVTAGIVALIAYAVYRNRYLRMLEIERVRTRIATDLHDDVGSSLSKISILSELLVINGNGNLGGEETESLQSIANTSRNVVGSMSDMVWSINPSRDNLPDTIKRMRQFALELLRAKDIEFTFDAPDDERKIKLDVDLRRHLYLVFKESLNNAVKYSNCTKIGIELKQKGDDIILRVSDNGDGFDLEKVERGNGLSNMQTRTKEMGGNFKINSESGKGTTIRLQIPRRNFRFTPAKMN